MKQKAKSVMPARSRLKLPFLHQKRYAIPLLILGVLAIILLLALPLMPQVQSVAQQYTTKHPKTAAFVPKSFRPPDVSLPQTGNWLVIPKAGIKLPIIEGSDIAVLNKAVGVWHQTGSLDKNYVIAGHRLQYYRTVNQSLYHLDQLEVGDKEIFVILDGVAHEYKVSASQVVDKYAVDILNPTTEPTLTIYTCNDFFNGRRLTVTAHPID